MGCDIVGVGFEDNIYPANGEPAKEHHQLVEAMAEIAQRFGSERAKAAEVGQVLDIGRGYRDKPSTIIRGKTFAVIEGARDAESYGRLPLSEAEFRTPIGRGAAKTGASFCKMHARSG